MQNLLSRCLALVLMLTAAAVSPAEEAKLVSVERIWDQGKHNAFTDLIRWRDKWYCTFREADDHVGGDGVLRVLVSTDGKTWESAAGITEKGIDLRDPKLSITPDDRLMIVAGGSVYEGTKLLGRQPRVTFSKDGKEWTPPVRVLSEGEWLWRVTWHDDRAYGVSYDAGERKSPAAEKAAKTGVAPPGPAEWKLQLFASDDGVKYDLVTHLDVPGHPNETTLRFLPDGEMIALVRREGGTRMAWIGRSKSPYKQWSWKETKHQVGGPNFIQLPDGSLWAAGRSYPGGAKTAVAKMTADGGYEPVLTLKSGGDTSYPGLVWHDGLLWMSFYSSHEGKTSIYLAKIDVPLASDKDAAAKATDSASRLALDDATRARCLKVLRTSLASDEFWPAMHAAEALSLAGHGQEVQAALAARLPNEKDDQKRCGLARELVRAGDTAKAQIMLDILASSDPHGHVHACESLYKVRHSGDGKLLQQAMSEHEKLPRKGLMAAAALARAGDASALIVIRKYVDHPDHGIASVAAWILARVGDESDLPALRAGAKRYDDRLTQAYFEHALATLGDAAGRAALVANLSQADGAVRVYACEFAPEANAVEARDQLVKLLEDPVLDVRIRAAQALLALAK